MTSSSGNRHLIPPVRSRRKTKLLVAALLGLVSATLSFAYLQGSTTSSQTVAPPTAVVLTAAKAIAAQSIIQPEMVVLKRIPLASVIEGGFQTPEEAVGTAARYPISAGEQITPVKVSRGQPVTALTAAITAGHRAMAINASAVVTAGGMLQPGDRVDVLAVVKGSLDAPGTERLGEALSIVLVQDAAVLAVAQRLVEVVPPPVSAGSPGDHPKEAVAKVATAPATTVTLALTPQDAQRVLLYEQQGVIRLIVRPATPGTAGGQ